MTAPHRLTLSRREALEWLARISLISVLPGVTRTATRRIPAPTASASGGYGTDPNLNAPVVPWSLIMEQSQLQLTAVLADLILPATAIAPAPSALGVADFVNEWVSAPYPEQLQDRATIFAGFHWIDAESNRRSNLPFLDNNPQIQQGILGDIAKMVPETAFAHQACFFQRLRFLVVSAYYTTPDGFRDIGYYGNVALSTYPPLTNEESVILEGALSKLGLSEL